MKNRVMNIHEKINYIEFPSRDIEKTKVFFSEVFAWKFQDFWPEYTAFSHAGMDGGFYSSDQVSSTINGSSLIVFYSENLKETQKKILLSGGTIEKEIFSFPGGSRFHFLDPNGNEYAVWTKDNNS